MQLTAWEDVAEVVIEVYVECDLPPPPKPSRSGYSAPSPFRAMRGPSRAPDADPAAGGAGAPAAAGGADKDAADGGDKAFVLAYAGTVGVHGGRDVGPCGGRFHLLLHPRPEELLACPSPAAAALAEALAAAPPLRVHAAALPVALPSTPFVAACRAAAHPAAAPCYPCALLDAEYLDTDEVRIFALVYTCVCVYTCVDDPLTTRRSTLCHAPAHRSHVMRDTCPLDTRCVCRRCGWTTTPAPSAPRCASRRTETCCSSPPPAAAAASRGWASSTLPVRSLMYPYLGPYLSLSSPYLRV